MRSTYPLALLFALGALACGASRPDATSRPTLALPPEAAVSVARAYFEAMQARDLDAAAALFTTPSSVFETGGREGSFEHYAAHHLGPELAAIERFEIRPGEPEVVRGADGTLALVAYPIEYDIDLADGREIRSSGTVTFVLISRGDQYAVRHLHWSSRARREAAAH